eukprot:TRINITY_DN3088_c0_g1_i4.p1 TRINITY_DN3088_c0_g1~~TRINITY_DN3088_c0_g1_i4.p1  ORF type:complete len:687 (-),score=204.33 TRINITY_DN3088_c0_g1_i4:473-2533(-)
MKAAPHLLGVFLVLLGASSESLQIKDHGAYLGDFRNHFHGVGGRVYAIDSRTLFIEGFAYDGVGPDAFFYGGYGPQPSGKGFIIPNEAGSKKDVLKSYEGEDILLTLPTGKSLRHLKWISVWCRAFEVNFGDLIFEERIRYPKPVSISPLKGIHKVKSSKIVIVDAQTLLIPKFSYDGSAPDAHFWVGSSAKPSPEGHLLLDENGSSAPLRSYDQKTIVLVLPNNLTVYDINWFSVWCIEFFVDFGSIPVPKGLKVPPSLKMLGIEPQSKLNCEVLDNKKGLEVRWAIAGDNVVIQLVGKLDDKEYLGFGASGSPRGSLMLGSDVVVTWMSQTSGKGFATDYFLESKSQCAGSQGACPDSSFSGGRNDIHLLNSAVINDYSMFTYRKKLKASDPYDIDILVNQTQAVIWATGPINSKGEVSYHTNKLKGDLLLDFGRVPRWNCPLSSGKGFSRRPSSSSKKSSSSTTSLSSQPRRGVPRRSSSSKLSSPWTVPPIPCGEPEDGLFFAQIGPTGGKSGYASITGHAGWGIAWYLNGRLIPEINLVRGRTYTFIVEGGKNSEVPAKYHPFYITDDPEGGYQYKTPEQRDKIRVFAGVEQNESGEAFPSGSGRLCEWVEKSSRNSRNNQIDASSFESYRESLELNCQEGQPGIIRWTPDENTPDLVYYQCFTHRHLGWKIHVKDQCKGA